MLGIGYGLMTRMDQLAQGSGEVTKDGIGQAIGDAKDDEVYRTASVYL